MNYHVTFTGEFAKGAKPRTPLWVKRAQLIRRVIENANDKRYPWEVRVKGARWT